MIMCIVCGYKIEKDIETGVMIKCPGCGVMFTVEGVNISG